MNPLNHTTCEHCVFKKVDSDNIQTGCVVNRLEDFRGKNLTEDKGTHHIIKTLCNSCRNENWASNKIERGLSLVEEMKVENSQFDAIIYVDEKDEWKDVQKTLGGLTNIKKLGFCVYRNPKMSDAIVASLVSHKGNWDVIDCFEFPNRTIGNMFAKSRTEYCLFVKAGEVPDTNLPHDNKAMSGHFINRDLASKLVYVDESLETVEFREAFSQIISEFFMRPDLV